MAEHEGHWDKDNSNKFCRRHLFLILRQFQDIGAYLPIRVKVQRRKRIKNE